MANRDEAADTSRTGKPGRGVDKMEDSSKFWAPTPNDEEHARGGLRTD